MRKSEAAKRAARKAAQREIRFWIVAAAVVVAWFGLMAVMGV